MKWHSKFVLLAIAVVLLIAIAVGEAQTHTVPMDAETAKHVPAEIRALLIVTPVPEPKVTAPPPGAPSGAFQRSQERTQQLSGGETRSVNSTCYNLRGTMASGKRVYAGAVAMNGVAFGTRYEVLSGPVAGRVFTVEDRIGHGSQFDIWMSSGCSSYGRRQITIRRVS